MRTFAFGVFREIGIYASAQRQDILLLSSALFFKQRFVKESYQEFYYEIVRLVIKVNFSVHDSRNKKAWLNIKYYF
ncbi:hypothetical protein FGO68_gene13460 [Halteria grandinella]|uniref:Uncharacterized protein n=1 Tax=Halteria grandinella TaxID=5974 RepID=A0A8J8NWI9_HALGN|nr:hypothetical protein FGO68_gene13460 [Halteria grandinella]